MLPEDCSLQWGANIPAPCFSASSFFLLRGRSQSFHDSFFPSQCECSLCCITIHLCFRVCVGCSCRQMWYYIL